MAIIPQKRLFDYSEIEELGDLERLNLVLKYIPDEELMQRLEKERGKGRDDYPIRGMWNSILAGVIYQHPTIESLRRELSRNGQLRYMCGLDKTPTPWAYSRFLTKLLSNQNAIEAMFDELVAEIKTLLPDFGKKLAIDGKAIESYANSPAEEGTNDRRKETDADYGKKVYRGENENGNSWETVKSWFGYKLHLLIDANYELPVAFEITEASRGEAPEAHKLLKEVDDKHPEILEDGEVFLADRGYDDSKLIKKLWDIHGIKPVIDIRNMWKNGEDTRLIEGEENIVYDYCGRVFCYDPQTGERREMAYGGFEKKRDTLKMRCPAKHYGIECVGEESCPVAGSIRINLSEDRRVFTPIARASYRWDREYKDRTAVERVNSRLDTSFGFENHTIRGLDKMKFYGSLSFIIMLAMAVGRIKEKQADKMRSLVKSA